MKNFNILLTSCLVLLSCNNPKEQIILLAKSVDSTHQSVVAILRMDSTGKTILTGSGVLIHPNVILTAGHTNFSEIKLWQDKNCSPIGYISFGNNALKSNDRIPFNWLTDVETHPDQSKLVDSYSDTTGKTNFKMYIDIGLIFLDQPVLDKHRIQLPDSNALAKINKHDLLLGVGYGYDKVDTVFQRIPGLIDGNRRKWKLYEISLINDMWLKTNCDSASNLPFIGMFDSGAPLLLNDTLVVGIWCGGENAPEPCLYSSLAVRIDNPNVLKWIKDTFKTRLGTQTK